jgi:hypothetical protein
VKPSDPEEEEKRREPRKVEGGQGMIYTLVERASHSEDAVDKLSGVSIFVQGLGKLSDAKWGGCGLCEAHVLRPDVVISRRLLWLEREREPLVWEWYADCGVMVDVR